MCICAYMVNQMVNRNRPIFDTYTRCTLYHWQTIHDAWFLFGYHDVSASAVSCCSCVYASMQVILCLQIVKWNPYGSVGGLRHRQHIVYMIYVPTAHSSHTHTHTEHAQVHTPNERLSGGLAGWMDWNVIAVRWNGINDIRDSTEIEEGTRENCANTRSWNDFVLLCECILRSCLHLEPAKLLFHFKLAKS